MATNRVKGITIQIAGDTTQLDKSLRSTDAEISKVQRDLREVERLLKLDPTNVDLLAQKQRLLAQQSELATKRLETMETAASQLDKTLSKSKLDDFNLELDLTKARAQDAARELEDFDPILGQVNDSADDAADSLSDVDGSASGMKNGFSIAGAAIAEFAGGAMLKLVDVALQAVDALWNLDEATEEYRESMAMLNTAYETAGYSQETATEAYRGFFQILGETDRATEASQLLAQLATDSEDVSKWIDIAAGAYGTFGDSLPVESLIEAANETAKTGEVTGVLADALNWVGVSEDYVNQQLSQLGDETSRAQLLMALLSNEYSSAADAFYENNEAIIAARDAQAEMDEATGTLGQAVSDLKTKLWDAFGPYIVEIIKAVAKAIEFITPLIDGIAFAIGVVIDAVKTLVGWIMDAVDWFLELIGVSDGSKKAGSSAGTSEQSLGGGTTQRAALYSVETLPDNIPALAYGGLIPPNNPFLAVLGDNRQETEVVSPLSTIEEAVTRAMSGQRQSGVSTSRPLVVNLIMDGQKLARATVPYLDAETTRAGVNIIGR